MTTTTPHKALTVGQLVKHHPAFLRSCGWMTDVPVNGRVIDAGALFVSIEWKPYAKVEWSDGVCGIIGARCLIPEDYLCDADCGPYPWRLE